MKKLFASLTFATMLIPQTLIAQEVCSITAMDTVAGLGTTISASGCTPDTALPLTLNGNGQNKSYTLTSNAQGAGTIQIPGNDLTRSGTYQLVSPGGSTSFSVLADKPDIHASRLNVSKTFITPDGADQAMVELMVTDRFNNPLSGRPVALLSNRQEDQISASAAETDATGRMTWSVRTRTAGTITLTAYDILSTIAVGNRGTITAGSASIGSMNNAYAENYSQSYQPQNYYNPYSAQLTGFESGGEFGAIDHFEVQILGPKTVNANDALSLSITAVDASNRVVENYVGNVTLKSTDSRAVLPQRGTISFIPQELGRKTISLGLTFLTSGEQTLFAEDQTNTSVRGSVTVSVQGGTIGGDIQVLDPPNGSKVGGTSVLLQGKAPSFVNLRVKGGAAEVAGESDAEGVFRILVPLNPDQRDHTLFVISDNGRYESAPHRLILDTEAPSISSITFTPNPGVAAGAATVVVATEPDVKQMIMELGGQQVPLNMTQSGSFTTTFTAPAAGNYDVKVTATDEGGNAATVLSKWTVEGSGVPTVTNVQAAGEPNAVAVSWQMINDPRIMQYRIYIGTEPNNFLYGLNTGQPVGNAVVRSLMPGKTYYIAVTALNEKGEESEKSPVVTASPVGMALTATPNSESVMLEWSPPTGLPLTTYILEYGVDSGRYTEKRTINGELRMYVVRDLLNDVTYEFKLTPVALNGQVLDEFAGTIQATPSGSGFHAGAPDPIPPELVPSYPEYPIDDVPNTPSTGIPSMMVWFGGIASVLIGYALYAHRKRRFASEEFLMTMDNAYRGNRR